ncbi:hypothetical protein [Sulfurimonas hydrogeniphila]|uniref:hypothetical protein n=1 Tax=Sulfurimonas TaxID=202746 RepID=UPI00125EAC57|nr:hypothetical protein [Sulfurimonas hydrogeniphila]
MEFWEQKNRLKSKPTLKNKTILTLEQICKKYNLSMGMAIESIFDNKIDYLSEHEEVKDMGYMSL